MIVVLMGVMGAGKTAVGTVLAEEMGVPFIDADDHHSAKNKEKMHGGMPLNDEDRQPWLETLNGLLLQWHGSGAGGVMACSALKEQYRAVLRGGMPEGAVHFVMLDAEKELLAARLAARSHEYMNNGLLQSQLETLETPRDALVIMNDLPPQEVAVKIMRHLQTACSGAA